MTATPLLAIAKTPIGLQIPAYLHRVYWWAYVHPGSVRLFERDWLIDLILFGNYRRLCDAAMAQMGSPIRGATLQMACAYGNLTARLLEGMDPDASLTVVDIVPLQLKNLARKLPADRRVALRQADTSCLDAADASFDQVLIYFLLHEQPALVRKATLAEAIRVVKPGGRIVIVDYHRPAKWHPLRPLVRLVFRWLEPFAIDLWQDELTAFLPMAPAPICLKSSRHFGGLYQVVALTR